MSAVHPAENLIVKRLDSHADTVHSKLKQALDISGTFLHYVIRVDLDSELVIWSFMSSCLQSRDDPSENRKGQHRRGAAAYV